MAINELPDQKDQLEPDQKDQLENEMTLSDRARVGRRLIWAAWGVEIIAAGIGLLIAVLIIVSTQARIQGLNGQVSAASGIMSAFLGGLPFIMVAVVELTKIPLATACYHARSHIWKWVLGFGLLFLMVITFETILNGFERNFTQRTYVIKQLKKKLIHTNEEISKVESDTKSLSAITAATIRQEFENEIDQIDRNRATEFSNIENQIQQAKITHSGRQAEVIRDQKATNDEEMARIDAAYTEDKKRINSEFEKKTALGQTDVSQQQLNLRERVASLKSDIDKLNNQKQQELSRIKDPADNSSALSKEIERIEKDFASRIAKVEETLKSERESSESKIGGLRDEISELQETKIKELEALSFFTTDQERKDTAARFDVRIESLKIDLDSLQSRVSTIDPAERIAALDREKDNQIENIRGKYGEAAASGQTERSSIDRKYAGEVNPIRQRLRSVEAKLANLSAQTLISDAANERDQKFKDITDRYQKRRKELEVRGDQLANQLASALSENKDKLQPILDSLQRQRSETTEKYAELREKAQRRHSANQEDLTSRENQVADLRVRSAELRQERLSLRDEINRNAEDSQIYRVTALWVGKDSPADITNEELRTVSFIWFGSLAAITAWTGTLLAFAGLAVRYGGGGQQPRLRVLLAKALHGIRALAVDSRRRARKPIIKEIEKEVVITVEVTKEVPVDKVVFKEVPKEVIRKELVYVPFFSDDPGILSRTVDEFGLSRSAEDATKPDPPSPDDSGDSETKAAAE